MVAVHWHEDYFFWLLLLLRYWMEASLVLVHRFVQTLPKTTKWISPLSHPFHFSPLEMEESAGNKKKKNFVLRKGEGLNKVRLVAFCLCGLADAITSSFLPPFPFWGVYISILWKSKSLESTLLITHSKMTLFRIYLNLFVQNYGNQGKSLDHIAKIG